MVKIDLQANLKWGGRAGGWGGERCFDISKTNALWVCFGIFLGLAGWVLGCPCRLVPERASVYIVLIGMFDSCKGALVAAAGPVRNPRAIPGFCKCPCGRPWALVFVSPFYDHRTDSCLFGEG